jgi:sRNA-binding protein
VSKDKGKNGKKSDDKPRAKLEKARDRLTELEVAYARAQAKAEKRMLEAQEKAEKTLAKARERLEAQQGVVARREAQLAPVAPEAVVEDEELHAPEVAADRLEAVESNGSIDGQGAANSIVLPETFEGSIVLPEGTEPPTGESSDPFRS